MPFAARYARLPLAAAVLIAFTGAGLTETVKKADKGADKPELIGTYGDWSVFQSMSGKDKICYTLAQPKTRDPADLKRDPAYAFISERPAEHVRNEVSFIMGFDVGGAAPAADAKDTKDAKKEGDKDKKKSEAKDKDKKSVIAPTATIGDSEFALLPKGADLWVKNPAQESQLIDEMRKGQSLKIKAASKKGNVTVDTYSLAGFKQAIDKALKDCAGG